MINIFIFLSEIFTCDHDFIQSEVLRHSKPENLLLAARDPEQFKTTDREPLRIHFDTNSLKAGYCDPGNNGANCNGYPTLTTDSINTIKTTIANMENLVEKYLNVTKNERTFKDDTSKKGIDLLNHGYTEETAKSSFYNEVPLQQENCDLYIIVRVTKYSESSSVLAQASATAFSTNNEDYGRPLVGFININLRKVPSAPQDLTSGNRQFFMTVLHEFTHVLGFSSSRISLWIDRSDGKNHENPVVSIQSYGLSMTYVQTPYLQKYVNDRFQLTSKDVLNIGMQLEDYGGSGTAGSHPNEHLFFTEYMQGMTFGPGYLTELSLNAMLDTGWYDIDFSVAETLSYLDAELYQFQPNETIVLGPPTLTFPTTFDCTKNKDQLCFYDYAYTGACITKSASQIAGSTAYGWYPKYYNPENRDQLGSFEVLDFMPVLTPGRSCRDSTKKGENAESYLEDYTDTSICMHSTMALGSFNLNFPTEVASCHKTECGTDGRLRVSVTVKGEEIWTLCKEEGQTIRLSGTTGKLICPDPAKACASVPKTLKINIQTAMPDRGPKDGKNLIAFHGSDFDKYPDLEVNVSAVPCNIIGKRDDFILCQLEDPANYLDNLSESLLVPLPINTRSVSANLVSVTEEMYTFMNRLYDAGVHRFSPAFLLICFTAVISILITL